MGTEAAEHVSAGDFNGASTIPQTTDNRAERRAGLIELSRRRDFAVRCWTERADGALVEQLFVNLDSAAKKADRARARGLAARLELVRVVPVQPLDGGDLR
ncbi:hypothetical protein [Barrientosiimonas humi]|uniref:hypothetical protein n=1 Tax=Barrientosiimonas humi TaxID=999931 RepID=UPI001477756A|nr:hypothetical protein [Barrientosiimonas humi]